MKITMTGKGPLGKAVTIPGVSTVHTGQTVELPDEQGAQMLRDYPHDFYEGTVEPEAKPAPMPKVTTASKTTKRTGPKPSRRSYRDKREKSEG